MPVHPVTVLDVVLVTLMFVVIGAVSNQTHHSCDLLKCDVDTIILVGDRYIICTPSSGCFGSGFLVVVDDTSGCITSEVTVDRELFNGTFSIWIYCVIARYIAATVPYHVTG